MLEEYIDNFQNQYEQFPNGKLFRLQFDNITKKLRITSNNRNLFDELRNAFSYDNPGAFFSKQYGYRAQEKIYNINQFGYFNPGMIYDVLQWIKTNYGSLASIAISEKCSKYISDYITPLKQFITKNGNFQISNISEDIGRNQELSREGKNKFDFRDYQREAIEALLFKGYGRGLIEIPTAGGKSFIIANLIWNLIKNVDRKMKFLILVPNVQLVSQFYGDLIDYGYNENEIARLMGGMSKKEQQANNASKAKIIISNRQFLFKNLDKLPKIDCMICDEVHQALASASADFIENYDCKLKMGCSGTLPRDLYSKRNLIGMFSKIVYEQKITNLQKDGYISKLNITLLDIFDKEVDANKDLLFNLNTNKKFHQEEDGSSDLFFNDAFNAELEYYNKFYVDLYTPVINYISTLNENTLVLFDKIELGQSIFNLAKEKIQNKNIYYIDGQTPVEERENIRTALEKSGDNILVGNVAIVGTGINIKRLNNIVFLINTKSHSRVLQSIGRILRLHSTKDVANLIDVRMNFKYSYKHYNERLQFYKEFYNKKRPDNIIRIEI